MQRKAITWVSIACLIAAATGLALFMRTVPDLPSQNPLPLTPTHSTYGTEIILEAESDGHFYLEALVDRSRITFLIDTGASISVLNPDDARELRLETRGREPTHEVQTGGGTVKMTAVTLPRIEVGQLRLEGLQALVTEVDMPHSVLGMNFLRRLRSYSVESGKMVLVP